MNVRASTRVTSPSFFLFSPYRTEQNTCFGVLPFLGLE
jgi:hypothetical protein